MRRLSRRQIPLIVGVVALGCLGVFSVDCYIVGGCHFSLVSSLLSAILGFAGTVVIAAPSIMRRLGETETVRDAKRYNRSIKSAYHQLIDGEVLEEGDEAFEDMEYFIRSKWGSEGNISRIELKELDGQLGNPILVDGSRIPKVEENSEATHWDIMLEMKSYMRRVTNLEEGLEERQERLFVLLGGSIYGQAIIFQALSTVIPNLDSFGL